MSLGFEHLFGLPFDLSGCPQVPVAEVLLDPVLVGRSGVVVLHAGVRLLPPEDDPEAGPLRRLSARGPAHLR